MVCREVVDVNQDELGVQGIRKRFQDKIEVSNVTLVFFTGLRFAVLVRFTLMHKEPFEYGKVTKHKPSSSSSWFLKTKDAIFSVDRF